MAHPFEIAKAPLLISLRAASQLGLVPVTVDRAAEQASPVGARLAKVCIPECRLVALKVGRAALVPRRLSATTQPTPRRKAADLGPL